MLILCFLSWCEWKSMCGFAVDINHEFSIIAPDEGVKKG